MLEDEVFFSNEREEKVFLNEFEGNRFYFNGE